MKRAPTEPPSRRGAPLIEGAGLVNRKLRVQDDDVVWLRAVLEAYDGLAELHGDGSGMVTLSTTGSRAGELDQLIDDLAREVALQRIE